MPDPVINGDMAPFVTARTIEYDPQKGFVTKITMESAGDNLNGIAANCITNKIAFSHQRGPRKSILTYTSTTNADGGPDINSDTWQLVANEVQHRIESHPKFADLNTDADARYTANLSLPEGTDEEKANKAIQLRETSPGKGRAGSLADVLLQVKNHNEGLPFVDYNDYTFDPEDPLAGDLGAAALLFNDLIHGKESYEDSQYVLRHSTNVSNVYKRNVADANVNQVYSTEEFIKEIGSTKFWAFPAPGRLIAKIDSIEVQVETNRYVFWGWRKLPSTETTAANNRVDITTEYHLAGWSRIYDIAAYNPDDDTNY